MKKVFYSLLLLICVALMLTACSTSASPSSTPDQSPTATITPSATPEAEAATLDKYCIIYPEVNIFTGSRFQQLAFDLNVTIKSKTGTTVEPYEAGEGGPFTVDEEKS